LTRREFLKTLGRTAVAIVTGGTAATAGATAPPRQLTFKVTGTMSVAVATLAAYTCQRTCGGRLFIRVGVLAGNLQYLVNSRLPLMPAVNCQVKRGDTITWRKV